jgi:hypothetical protein
LDCTSRRTRRGETVFYDSSLAIAGHGSAEADTVWHEVPPETPIESVLVSTCNKARVYGLPMVH